MTQPPEAQPPAADAGNPWQTPPAGGSPVPPPDQPAQPPDQPAPPPYPPAPPDQPAPPSYQPGPPPYPPAPPYQPPSYQPPAYQPPPPPSYQPPGPGAAFPDSAPPAPTNGFPQPGPAPQAYPGSAPPYPGTAPPYPPYPGTAPFPPYFGAPPPRRRGPLIAVIVLVALVVLGAGGLTAAYLLTRNADGAGKTSPTAAAQSFLEAVYVDQDPAKVAPLVCSAARDTRKIRAKITEIKQQDQQYDAPKYTWSDLDTESSTKDHAVISTTVTLTTANVQKATEKLKLTVVKSNGWFVCDVQQGS